MNPARFHVNPGESGMALAAFVSRHLNLSGKKTKHLLDRRLMLVNGRRVWMARHALQAGDTVEIVGTEPHKARLDRSLVLWEDEDCLIVNKPPCISTNGPSSLESALRTNLSLPQLTAVHRLDRDTSGCLLIAKRAAMEQALVALFREHKIHKLYHAIVIGLVDKPEFTLTQPLDHQPAITHVKVLDANRLASHLLIILETGRTHQIRKHMIGLNHPIAGDPVYATRRALSSRERRIPRQMLHASRIEFVHPFKELKVHCSASLPGDFKEGLRLFRLR